MTTFSILGDVHLGRQFVANVPLHRRGEREAKVWRTFAERLMRDEADVCICTGDLFDKPVVPYEVIWRAAETYRMSAALRYESLFVVLRGNHDASRDLEAVSAFDLFAALLTKNPQCLGRQGLLRPPGPGVLRLGRRRQRGGAGARVLTELQGQDSLRPLGYRCPLRPLQSDPNPRVGGSGNNHSLQRTCHLPQRFRRDGVDVTVAGSMLPYAFGEDATGDTYVTLSLDELSARDDLHDKCVRVVLKPGEVFDSEVDCLQLQVQRAEGGGGQSRRGSWRVRSRDPV